VEIVPAMPGAAITVEAAVFTAQEFVLIKAALAILVTQTQEPRNN